jgi:hypothetical protein
VPENVLSKTKNSNLMMEYIKNMNKNRVLFISTIICFSIFLAGCYAISPSATIAILKSDAAKNKAYTLSRESPLISGDSAKYARYYIYRSDRTYGSALAHIIYDNNEYVTLSEVLIFEKYNYVTPGDHFFTSKIDAKESVNFIWIQEKLISFKHYQVPVLKKEYYC